MANAEKEIKITDEIKEMVRGTTDAKSTRDTLFLKYIEYDKTYRKAYAELWRKFYKENPGLDGEEEHRLTLNLADGSVVYKKIEEGNK